MKSFPQLMLALMGLVFFGFLSMLLFMVVTAMMFHNVELGMWIFLGLVGVVIASKVIEALNKPEDNLSDKPGI